MPNWTPAVALPNLHLNEAIECGEHAAFAPASDERVAALTTENEAVGNFLSRFTNAFGRHAEPALLILRDDAPQRFFTAEAIAGLRDAMSISTVPFTRALQLHHGGARYFVWSNFFLIYPWMVARDSSGLVALTPAISGFDEIDDFNGQSSPEIFIQPMDRSNFDRPLREKLIEKWNSRYTMADPLHEDIALFRSLNMAFSASTVPSGPEGTYYDVGRLVALWISAFEIIARPANGSVNLGVVYALLQNAPWYKAASRRETHQCFNNRGAEITSINGCWLYGLLYKARNNFLHGNPTTGEELRLPSGRNLFEIAAPLFRMALTSALSLTFSEPGPDPADTNAYANHLARRMRFLNPQSVIEDALLDAHRPPH